MTETYPSDANNISEFLKAIAAREKAKIARWYSKRQLADRYNVCPRSIERWVQNKKFPPGVRLPNGHWAWSDITIEAHERAMVVGTEASAA
jgi:hypothetical protein